MTYRPRHPALTSRIMGTIRSKDTKTEVELRKALFRRGLRYRIHYREAPGSPDIAFPKRRVAVFIDGDFWHGRVLREHGQAGLYAKIRSKNRAWWGAKLAANIERDERVNEKLREEGWRVLRYWESEIARNIEATAEEIVQVVRRTEG